MPGDTQPPGAGDETTPVVGGFAPVDPAMAAPAPPVLPAPPPPYALYAAPRSPYAAPAAPGAAGPAARPASAPPPVPARAYLYAQPPTTPSSYPPAAPWAPAPAPREPWPRRRTATVVIASVVAGAVLLAGAAASGAAYGRWMSQHGSAAVATRVQQEMPRLEAYVAQATGRPWSSRPQVEVLADADFLEALHGSDGGASPRQPDDDDDDIGVTATAMGLASDPDRFWDAASAGDDSNVTGFYDDSVRTLYVRGDSWEPIVEVTLVHELTHANQDQAFDLSRIGGATSTVDETWPALQSVIEGEATLVERDYAATQSAEWQQAVFASDSAGTRSEVPYVDTAGAFPYEIGAEFVGEVRRLGGTAAVDRAFTSPPLWTRDLLDPQAWLAGSLPTVRTPARPASPSGSAGDVADVGVLGVEGLWLAVDAAHPRMDSFAELSGWAGDSYVATEDRAAKTWCFVDDVVFTSPASKKKALEFLASWTLRTGVQVTQTSATGARLRACHNG